jgi:hypothetical protein
MRANEGNIAMTAARPRRRPQAGLAIIACLHSSLMLGWPAAAQTVPRRDDRLRMVGGTGMTGAMLGCKISKTETRAKELEERYQAN